MYSVSIFKLCPIVCRRHKSQQAVEPWECWVCFKKKDFPQSRQAQNKIFERLGKKDRRRHKRSHSTPGCRYFSPSLKSFSSYSLSHTHPNTSRSLDKSLQIQRVRVWFGVSARRSITCYDGCITSLFCHVITLESLWSQTALWARLK